MATTTSSRLGRLLRGRVLVAVLVGLPLLLPAEISAQTEPVPVPAGPVIMTDDFSNPDSGWFVTSSRFGSCAYDNGEYVVTVLPPSAGANFCSLREVARDYVAEVDARLPNGAEAEAVSLLARAKFLGPGQFRGYIRFAVMPATGRVRMASVLFQGQGADVKVLAEAEDHPAVNRGSATNRLGLKVLGSTFVSYVNGQEVLRVENDAFPEGNIALEVIGPRGNSTEARFDNLIVSQIGAE